VKTSFETEFDVEVGGLATFGVPARAAAVANWHTADDLAAIVADRSLPRPLKVIGGGSNLLFTKPFGGTLLVRRSVPRIEHRGMEWTADANTVLDDLCAMTATAGFRGMENLSGIPGTLGGALVQNAGAYGAETGDLLAEATLFDLQSGRTLTVGRDWMGYSYRHSRLKTAGDRYVILSATLRLQPGSAPANIGYGNLRATLGDAEPTPAAVRRAVLEVRQSKLPDVAAVGSAGSFFRNPEVDASKLSAGMPRYDLSDGRYKVPAAWLIDRAGMKGASVGGASTWPEQPLVIVNTDGRASAADVVGLEQKIVRAVEERFAITLTPEVEHL